MNKSMEGEEEIQFPTPLYHHLTKMQHSWQISFGTSSFSYCWLSIFNVITSSFLCCLIYSFMDFYFVSLICYYFVLVLICASNAIEWVIVTYSGTCMSTSLLCSFYCNTHHLLILSLLLHNFLLCALCLLKSQGSGVTTDFLCKYYKGEI